jgi:hypothetical protein
MMAVGYSTLDDPGLLDVGAFDDANESDDIELQEGEFDESVERR